MPLADHAHSWHPCYPIRPVLRQARAAPHVSKSNTQLLSTHPRAQRSIGSVHAPPNNAGPAVPAPVSVPRLSAPGGCKTACRHVIARAAVLAMPRCTARCNAVQSRPLLHPLPPSPLSMPTYTPFSSRPVTPSRTPCPPLPAEQAPLAHRSRLANTAPLCTDNRKRPALPQLPHLPCQLKPAWSRLPRPCLFLPTPLTGRGCRTA